MMFVIQIKQQNFEINEIELYWVAKVSRIYPFGFIFYIVIVIVFVFVNSVQEEQGVREV